MKKLSLGLVAVMGAFLMVPASGSAAPGQTSYGFEQCAEGWKVTETNDEAVGGDWDRSPPGANTSSFAFRIVPYPMAAYPGNPEAVSYEARLTSPTHVFSAPGKITYWENHNLETVEPPLEGGDFLYVELSKNGGVFKKIHTYQGLSPAFAQHEITVGTAGSYRLRFHLYSDNNISGEGNSGGYVAVDDIVFDAPRPAGTACAGGGGEQPPPKKCTKSGNAKANTIRGTAKSDRLCGKAGRDVLYGKGSKDALLGGKGFDKCFGGPGRDTFKGCERKKQ